MDRKRCAAPGCGRFVRRGAEWCRAHGAADEEATDERQHAREEFRRRLAQGDYRQLFDADVQAVMAQAAAEPGLADEIGALRIVLARLLLEEADLGKLVAGVARLVSATTQAARAQRAIAGETGQGLTEAINRFLAELET
ncbi:MAG TPA: hypothetical protein VIL01_08910 [Thermomicrobiales bacterium]